jgi:hypothetical protein
MTDSQTEEFIPEEDNLFYHIAKGKFAPYYNFDDIPPYAFTPVGNDLSVNWKKYCSTAEECLTIKTENYPNGRNSRTHGVGHFITGEVREIKFLEVFHSPSMSNKAHSLIKGIPPEKPKLPYIEMRKKLKRIFKAWDIRPIID